VLERATELDDGDPRVWDALGRALAAVGDPAAAVRAVERQLALHAAKGDAVGEARAHARVAALLEAQGDDDGAEARYRRALALAPTDDELVERVARLAARHGRVREAVEAYERLARAPVAAGDASPGAAQDLGRRRRAARELVRTLLAAGDPARARVHLDAAAGGAPEEEAERLELLAAVEEQSGRPGTAADALAKAAALEVAPARAAELELRRGRVCEAIGRAAEADAARAHAFELAPDLAATEAAEALAASARAHGDAAAEARWLDVLLRRPPGPGFVAWALRRAELALAAGRPQDCLALLDAAEDHGATARLLRARALAAAGNAAASVS
jgi:tetratricopeptide (TPR) repeat protein